MTSGRILAGGGFNVGKGDWVGLEKTDLNCSNKIRALDSLSLYNFPFSFRGATPLESCFLALI